MIGLIRKRGKLSKKFLNTELHGDYKYFNKEQGNIVQREIKQKKANYVREQL